MFTTNNLISMQWLIISGQEVSRHVSASPGSLWIRFFIPRCFCLMKEWLPYVRATCWALTLASSELPPPGVSNNLQPVCDENEPLWFTGDHRSVFLASSRELLIESCYMYLIFLRFVISRGGGGSFLDVELSDCFGTIPGFLLPF